MMYKHVVYKRDIICSLLDCASVRRGRNLIIIIFCQPTVFLIMPRDTRYHYLNFESIICIYIIGIVVITISFIRRVVTIIINKSVSFKRSRPSWSALENPLFIREWFSHESKF